METSRAPKPKLERGITVRLAPMMRQNLDGLAKTTGRDVSDIVRDGLSAFWPEIEALNRQLGHRASAEDVTRLRTWMDAGREAAALGIDLSDLVRRAKTAAAADRAAAA